jgi:hypothetical protein
MQDERKKICPKSAIDQVLAGLGVDEDCTVDEEVKSALGLLAENMLEQTMQFGALMASRRNSRWLQVCQMSAVVACSRFSLALQRQTTCSLSKKVDINWQYCCTVQGG